MTNEIEIVKQELMSVRSTNSHSTSSNNSFSSDEPEMPTVPAKSKRNPTKSTKKKTPLKRPPRYILHVAHVPKRTFDQIHRRMKKNKPVVDTKSQTLEKVNCNRFMFGQIDGNQMDTISPESTTRLMWEMRECLQRKEYGNLARLISAFTEMPMGKVRWYPTLIKYCLLVLLYDPLVQGTELMDLFLEGVMGCHGDADKKVFLKDICQLPNNIHVTKYDDLWTEYPTANQINRDGLDKLCKLLSDRLNVKSEDLQDSDSEWESYDENSSNEDNEETTEPEKVCDFNDAINRLQLKFTK